MPTRRPWTTCPAAETGLDAVQAPSRRRDLRAGAHSTERDQPRNPKARTSPQFWSRADASTEMISAVQNGPSVRLRTLAINRLPVSGFRRPKGSSQAAP
jgi:hypothetical protein